MSLYKIEYQLKEGEKSHIRYYKALTRSTALDMFGETVDAGSLVGEKPKDVHVTKMEPKVRIKNR